MAVNPVPARYRTITPYLVVGDAAALLRFLESGFGAVIEECNRSPEGKVMHAEAVIGDSRVMIGEAQGTYGVRAATLYLYVPDVDASWRRARDAGGKSLREPEDQFYGDRVGGVEDAFGNQWWIASRREEVPPDEMARRAAERHRKTE